MKTTLLAVDTGSVERIDRLVKGIVDVAGPTGVTVVIRYALTKDEYDDALDNLDFDTTTGEILADDVTRRHATARELTRRFDDADIDYITHGRVGHHGEEFVELASEVDADRLVVGGRKRSPIGKAVPGSVAQEVMFKASCPVTFVCADTK